MDAQAVSSVDAARRFGGLERLYGPEAGGALARLHVVVAGLGGVGTWCAEALARSGVGALTLVDLDHIAESNVNRQVHALSSTLGCAKVTAMADRVRDIHPDCHLRCIDDFVAADTISGVLDTRAFPGAAPGNPHDAAGWRHVLVDCTDALDAKEAMVLAARDQGWPLLVCGGAGGKSHPMSLRISDLARVGHDALLARLRYQLRRRHGFPRGCDRHGRPRRRVAPMRVDCLWFDEETRLPAAWQSPASREDGSRGGGLSCAGYGSVVTVTATMGMAAADWALHQALDAGRL